MDAEAFRYQCGRYRDTACQLHTDFVSALSEQLQHNNPTKDVAPFDSLSVDTFHAFLRQHQARVLHQDELLDKTLRVVQDKLHCCPGFLHQTHGLSFRVLAQRVNIPELKELVHQLPLEFPCKKQFKRIQYHLEQILLLLKQYSYDFQQLSAAISFLSKNPSKVLCIHYQRSFFASVLTSLTAFSHEVIHKHWVPQSKLVDTNQTSIQKKQKDFYHQVATTLAVDVDSLQSLLTLLQETHSVVAAGNLGSLTDNLQNLVQVVRQVETSPIHLLPVVDQIVLQLNLILNALASGLEIVASTEDNNQVLPLERKSNEAKGKISELPYIDLMLQEMTHLQSLQEGSRKGQVNILQQLATDEAKLRHGIRMETKQKEELQRISFGRGEPSECHMDKFIQSHVYDIASAKKLVSLDTDLERLRCEREHVQLKIREMRHACQETETKKKLLDRGLTYLNHWEKRQSQWKSLAQQEMALLASHRDFRFQYYKQMYETAWKWKSLMESELKLTETANVVIAQQMFRQLEIFSQEQWNRLRRKQRKLIANIKTHVMSLNKNVQQVSTLCPKESLLVLQIQHKMQSLLTEVDTFWNVRYQYDVVSGIQMGYRYLLAYIQSLIQELSSSAKNPKHQTFLSDYIQIRNDMTAHLKERQDNMGICLVKHVPTNHDFASKMVSKLQRP